MELLQTIALLCQINAAGAEKAMIGYIHHDVAASQRNCQQYYVHCVSTKRSNLETNQALERCVLEKK